MEKVVEQEKVAEKNEPTKEDVLDGLISKIEKNEFFIHFYCPAMNQPSGGIGVLLRIAAAYQDAGFQVKVWYEPSMNREASMQASQQAKKEIPVFDVFNPSWVDFDISNIQFLPLGEKQGGKILRTDGKEAETFPLQVATEDFMLIPEGFPNVMERTVGAPCKRIILAQSWLYILAGMKNGQIWQNFGIKDVVSVSDFISTYLTAIMPGIQIKSLKQGINREIFYKPEKLSDKLPVIGYQRGRGPESEMKIHNIIKMFYAANPHMRWMRFMELGGMSRDEFAERLRDCAFVLYTDEIAGFGTLPLEAMACGTHVVGYDAPGGREYATADNGFWGRNGDVFELAELLGIAAEKWVSGEIDLTEGLQESYEKTLENYTVEGEANRVLEIIEEYKKERIDEFSKAKKA
ncbi:MAG: glycosyltransferase [bacterium]|nr:glycosyltransferase [bacterium]